MRSTSGSVSSPGEKTVEFYHPGEAIRTLGGGCDVRHFRSHCPKLRPSLQASFSATCVSPYWATNDELARAGQSSVENGRLRDAAVCLGPGAINRYVATWLDSLLKGRKKKIDQVVYCSRSTINGRLRAGCFSHKIMPASLGNGALHQGT
ncbi:hypothetical protein BaRGS_00025985, partial [Batillaria attramentaria]